MSSALAKKALHLLRIGFFLAVAATLAGPSWAAGIANEPRFAQEKSDLKPEATLRFGTLPNGMRYVVRPNKEPKGRATLRLLIMSGSLYERDDQQGIAHFLEHMAFNGSTHYPADTLIEFFQRMGMDFGNDTNAYTSFDHTVYMLDLPDTKPETFNEAFQVFGDYVGGLLLSKEELDKERGIILSEKRARDSVEYRQMVAEYKFILGTTLFPKRLPIGEESVIQNAPRERFAEFYDTWYRPERMAAIVVGDFDPSVIEKLLAAKLGGLQARRPAAPAPNLGHIDTFEGLRINYRHEPEAGSTVVSLQTLTPFSGEPDTAATRLSHLPRDLAVSMLNRRLAILAKKENAPFTTARVDAGESYDFFRNSGIELTCQPARWQESLTVAEQELRRALEHGFDAAELAEASANVLNGLDQAVKTASTRRSPALASEIIRGLTQGEVITSPADEQALLAPAIARITTEDCTKALRETFSAPHRYVSVMGNTRIDGDAAAVIRSVVEKSAAQPVNAPQKISEAKFGYTEFGTPGQVKEQRKVEDLDVTLVTFANGVRLNIKKTDFEANRIHVSVRIGAGQLIEPRDKPGISLFASNTFTSGGLGRHDADELNRILAGKTVGAGFRVDDDALVLTGTTNPTDLGLEFQLLAAYTADPGYRPESMRMIRKQIEQFYLRLDHTPGGPLQREIPRLLASNDPRFGLPSRDEALARNLDEAREWLTPQLTTGAIEIAVVGDAEPAKVIEAVAQTFGALPPRSPKPPYDAERKVSFPAEPFSRTFTVPTEIPKGVVSLYWPTTDMRDVRLTRRLRLLGDVFSDRLRVKIREQLGESYSPQAASAPSDTYWGYGFLYTMVTVDPAKAEEVMKATLEIADEIAKNGVTDDELARAKLPVLTAIRESARTNGYWLQSVLTCAQEFPERLEWSRTRTSDIESVTAAELTAIAKQYLPSSRTFRAIVVPAKPAAKTE